MYNVLQQMTWMVLLKDLYRKYFTITAQDNSSTDTYLDGDRERQDPNIKTSAITDDDGYLIVEGKKLVDEG